MDNVIIVILTQYIRGNKYEYNNNIKTYINIAHF